MLTYPMYYHDKNQEAWLTLNPRCYGKYAKIHKIFHSRFSKWLRLCLATSNDHNFNTFLDDSLHLNTKIISRICSFQNYLKIPQNELALVSWEWVTYHTGTDTKSDTFTTERFTAADHDNEVSGRMRLCHGHFGQRVGYKPMNKEWCDERKNH